VRRHPAIAKARLVVDHVDAVDRMTLHAEVADTATLRVEDVIASLREVTKLRGEVTLRRPGELANDGKVIDDQRKL
jgi:phenylacetate-CoA ligase